MGAALALAACGDDDDGASSAAGGSTSASAAGGYGGAPAAASSGSSSSASAASLKLTATEDGGLGFDPKSLTAKAGKVTIALSNPSGNGSPHAIAIDGESEAGEVVQPGGTSTVTATLKAGTYTFYCPVGSHRAQGMEGTLKVG